MIKAPTPYVSAEGLKEFCTSIFERAGMLAEHAAIQADVLVWANLHGVDSHGVLRVPRYVGWLEKGVMNPQPNIAVRTESVAAITMAADRAAGAVSVFFAVRKAIEKARSAGIGWVYVSQTTHCGPAGYFAELVAQRDMIGIVIATSRPNMAYYGAKAAGVATSPIAIAVPGGPDGTVLLDMATSAIARGKIKDALSRGLKLPEDVALTKEGLPTTDPAEAEIPMPLGGAKGSGLSLLFECLIGLVVNHPLLEPALNGVDKTHSQNALVVAVNIAAFTNGTDYRARMDALSAALRRLPAMNESEGIQLPGESKRKFARSRQSGGIPIPHRTWSELSLLAARVGVAMPDQIYNEGGVP